MAGPRSARGTAESKSSGTTLTLSGISVKHGSMLVVAIGYEDSQGHPATVQYGNHLLRRKLSKTNASGFGMSVWIIPRLKKDKTKNITVTWSAAIGARAMFVTELAGFNRVDSKSSKVESATTSPATGNTNALLRDNDFALGVFVSEGPVGDAPGTADIRDKGTFVDASSGQREGTIGGADDSNITIQETFLQLTGPELTRGRLQGATSRDWVSGVLAFRELNDRTTGVVPSDVRDVEDILESIVPPPNSKDLFFHYNDDADEWEAFIITSPGSPVASRDIGDEGDWTVA